MGKMSDFSKVQKDKYVENTEDGGILMSREDWYKKLEIPLYVAFSRKIFPWYVQDTKGKDFSENWKLTQDELWLVLYLAYLANTGRRLCFSIDQVFHCLTRRDPGKVSLAEIRKLFGLMESGVNKCNHVAEENGGIRFKIDWGKKKDEIQRRGWVYGEVIVTPVTGRGGFVYFSAVELTALVDTFEGAQYKMAKGAWMLAYMKSQFLRLGDPSKEYCLPGYAGGVPTLADTVGMAYQTCKSYLRMLLDKKLITLALQEDCKANVYLAGMVPKADELIQDIKRYGVISYRATKIGGRPTTKKEGEQDTFVV